MFMDAPDTLMYVAVGAFVLGWLVAKVSSALAGKIQTRKRDPRDDRIRNLDAELRYTMREQLSSLQERLGITAVYVTHDQEEALEMAHRIAVLKAGECHQIGTPAEILEQPATEFVDNFLARQRRLLMRNR